MTSILPISQGTDLEVEVNHKFVRNRIMFSLVELVFIALVSVQTLRRISHSLFTIPALEEVQDSFRRLQNATSLYIDAFSNASQDDVARQKEVVIPNAIQIEHHGIAQSRFANNISLNIREQHDISSTMLLQTKVDFLRKWSKAGHDLPYLETYSQVERRKFEYIYGLGNNQDSYQAPLQGILSESQTLRISLKGWILYNQDYIANKTRGLSDLVPAVNVSLGKTLIIDDAIRKAASASREKLVDTFRSLRNHYAELYSALTVQLLDTRDSLDKIAEGYDRLVDFAIRISSFAATIPIPKGTAFPSIDLGAFPPADFYKPEFGGVPRLGLYLAEFDSFLLTINTSFDTLADEIVETLYISLKSGAEAVVDQIANFALQTDYHPPMIRLGDANLSPIHAVDILDAIETNVSLSFSVGVEIEAPDLFVHIPTFEIPTLDVADQTVASIQSVVDFFVIKVPSLDIPMPQWLRSFVTVLISLWGMSGFAILFAFRAGRQIHNYWDGSAIRTPIVDMRTKSEQNLENARSAKTSTILFFLRTALREDIWGMTQYAVIAVFAFALVTLVYFYETAEFRPYCVASNQGTTIGRYTIAPLFYNGALRDSQTEVWRHNTGLQAFAQQQCQVEARESEDSLREQLKQLATIQQSAAITDQYNDLIYEALDFNALCVAIEMKCGGKVVFEECPRGDDGLVVVSPCRFLPQSPLSMEVVTTTLDARLFNCSQIPTSFLEVSSAHLMDHLNVADSTCLLEWYALYRFWQWAFILFSWNIIQYAIRPLFVCGLQVILRHHLGREEFRINATSFVTGAFSQPEYDDIKARGEAIAGTLFWLKLFGYGKFLVGVSLLAGWFYLISAAGHYQAMPMSL